MRIGVFGGSFDPIHLGHLLLAEQCLEHAQLDRVLFVPASVSPLKQQGPIANDRQRIEMTSLAIAGHRDFEVSTLEIERGEKSYTVETLIEVADQNPNDEIFLLMGQDSLLTFEKWKEPQKICELATLLVIGRPNSGIQQPVDLDILKPFVDSDRLSQFKSVAFESRLIDISSTDIRQRVVNGLSIRFLTPRAVEKYIETAKLYLAN